jgi:hypothetical protein
MTLGFLKSTGFAFGRAGQMVAQGQRVGKISPLGQAFVRHSPKALSQMGMLTGIMMGHGAEMALGWRPGQSFGSLFTDSLIFWAQFNIGGALSQRAFPGLYRFNAKLNHRVQMQELEQVRGLRGSAPVVQAGEMLRGIQELLGGNEGPPGAVGGLRPAYATALAGESGGPKIVLRPSEGPREARDLNLQMSGKEGPEGPGEGEPSEVKGSQSEEMSQTEGPPGPNSSESSTGNEAPSNKPMEITWDNPKQAELLREFLSPRLNPEISRLYDALKVANAYFQSGEGKRDSQVNQQVFLDRVLQELARTEGIGSHHFDSAFSVLQGIRSSRTQLQRFIMEMTQPDSPEIRKGAISPYHKGDPLSKIIGRYPIDNQGGYKPGTRVDGGRPQRVLKQATRMIRDLNGSPSQFKVLVEEMRSRKVTKHGDGRVEIIYSDGRSSTNGPDGSFKVVYPDGRELVKRADGSIYIRSSREAPLTKAVEREVIELRPISERIYEARQN